MTVVIGIDVETENVKIGFEAAGHYSCNLLGFLLNNG